MYLANEKLNYFVNFFIRLWFYFKHSDEERKVRKCLFFNKINF